LCGFDNRFTAFAGINASKSIAAILPCMGWVIDLRMRQMRLTNIFTGLGMLVMLVGMNASFASEQVGQWYVSGLGTYIDPDSDRNLDSEFAGFKLAGGFAIDEKWNVEIEASMLDVTGDGGPDTDFTGLLLNGMYLWNRADKFTPYILAGAGYLDADQDGGDTNEDLQLQAGPGFLWDFTDSGQWSLRSELLIRWADDDQSSAAKDLLLNVGVQYAFGGSNKNSSAKSRTNASAPPPSAEPIAAPAATGAIAAAALDTDGDGVPDIIDECPNTVQGAKVNDVGCAYELTLSGTNYDVNAAILSESGQQALNNVAESLKNFPEVNITIEGYTDSDGSEAFNQDLSDRRAKSARDYLVRRGVAGTRITAYGRGESNPIASNDTPEGRAQNRRVVLTKDQ
jgi:OOP family OmpA-OmpF porin